MSFIKLIRKYLFISILIILVTGCISHYLIFRFFIHYSSDRMLKEQKTKIENYIAQNDTLPLASTLVLKPARITVKAIEFPDLYVDEIYKDTIMYSKDTGTFTPYRQLLFTVSYRDKYHLITINQPTVISNDLFYAIATSLLLLFALFVLFTYVIEYFLKKNVWSPLNDNLQKLHEYDLKANTELRLEKSGIQEFDEINEVILRMVDKINADYENSRLFIEDASHEMQTPLSIIKSKMDLLLQNPLLMQHKDNGNSVRAISRAVSRLSRLNKSLHLITRINNNQYMPKEHIRLDELLTVYLNDLSELFEAKKLTVETSISHCSLFMNSNLAEILLSNLLSNAIRHNLPLGKINLLLDNSHLVIINTCKGGVREDTNLFNRITFHNKSEDSLGLGLNIVKSICDKNGFYVEYDYPKNELFKLTIAFN